MIRKTLNCLKQKFKRSKEIQPSYSEYHFDGELGSHNVKAYEKDNRFYLFVGPKKNVEGSDLEKITSITYIAIPQNVEKIEGKLHQQNYDPDVVAVEIRKGYMVTKLDLSTNQSLNPRIQTYFNRVKEKFYGILEEVYKAKTDIE